MVQNQWAHKIKQNIFFDKIDDHNLVKQRERLFFPHAQPKT